MPQIRILVADDEPLARRGVRQLLAPHPDMRVVGESRNGPDTLRALEELKPDLLFLDVQMPEMDGFAVLRRRGVDRMPAGDIRDRSRSVRGSGLRGARDRLPGEAPQGRAVRSSLGAGA